MLILRLIPQWGRIPITATLVPGSAERPLYMAQDAMLEAAKAQS